MMAILSNDNTVGMATYFLTYAILVLLSMAVVIWWIVKRLFFKNNVPMLYLRKDGQHHGPYAIGDIRGWLSAGQLQATDLACYADAVNWTPLSSVPGIGIPVKKASPPTWLAIVALLALFGGISDGVRRVGSAVANPPVSDKIQWQTVSEDGFSALMPGKPVKHDETNTTGAGPVTVRSFLVDLERGENWQEYTVTCTEYPRTPTWESVDPAKIFDVMRRSFISTETKVLVDREISLDGNPGREIVFENPKDASGFTVVSRLYWAKPRLYTTSFMRHTTQDSSANGRKFLDSFKILSQQ